MRNSRYENTLEKILFSFVDHTQRKRAEAKLAESEELLSRTQIIAHAGSWRLDLTANRLTWSDEVYRIFGYEPQEFTATYEVFLDIVHPDDQARVDEAYSCSLKEGIDGCEIEHRIVRRDSGEVRHVHERCIHERDNAGAVIQSTGMVQDITERKQIEGSLQQKAEALRASNDELEFFNRAMVGRELRMIELKEEIDALCRRLGEAPRYGQ